MTTKTLMGTAQTVISMDSDVAIDDLSDRSDSVEFDNTNDENVPYAQLAEATLYVPNWGAAPADGDSVDLYYIKNEVGGVDTDDELSDGIETAGDTEAMHWAGSFKVWNDSEAQRTAIIISILGVRKAIFQVLNNTGQTIAGATGTATVKIRPISLDNV